MLKTFFFSFRFPHICWNLVSRTMEEYDLRFVLMWSGGGGNVLSGGLMECRGMLGFGIIWYVLGRRLDCLLTILSYISTHMAKQAKRRMTKDDEPQRNRRCLYPKEIRTDSVRIMQHLGFPLYLGCLSYPTLQVWVLYPISALFVLYSYVHVVVTA